MMHTSSRFAEVFKAEHRAIRDALLNLVQAFRNRDVYQVRAYLDQVIALAGPHFRYEEESLYPALVAVLDEEQVGKLLGDHDAAIEAVRNLKRIAAQDQITDQDAETGARYARNLLPHVYECDGLGIMAELLPENALQEVLVARERAQKASLDLLSWADRIRTRAVPGQSGFAE